MSAAPDDATEWDLLVAILMELRKLNASIAARRPAQPIVAADDRELDSPKGDPKVSKDPKKWLGEPMIGRRFSQCPVEYLEVVADFLSWKANNPQAGKDPKFADYDRRDAARALGWIRRLRAGWKPATDATPAGNGGYGSTGYGASAKHAGPPDDDYGSSAGDY